MSVDPADGREPVTIREHDQPWAADLESDRHANDTRLVVAEAIDAIEGTRLGVPVDLVTHECHGDPMDYLLDPLRSTVPDIAVTGHRRCTCGGYVITVVRRISESE